MPSASEDVQSGLPGPVQCIFPTAGLTRINGAATPSVVFEAIPIDLAPSLTAGIRDTEDVRAAWAMLLRQYVAQDTVSFRELRPNEEFKTRTEGAISVSKTGAWSEEYHVYHCTAGGSVRQHRAEYDSNTISAEHATNTAICIGSSSGPYVPAGSLTAAAYSRLEDSPSSLDLLLVTRNPQMLSKFELYFHASKITLGYATVIATAFKSLLLQRLTKNGLSQSDVTEFSQVGKLPPWKWAQSRRLQMCVHDKISDVASRHPSNAAVCSWDGNLTYDQLEHLSDHLAEDLVRAGTRPGDFVLFMMEKSLWAVVAALAILKAGGALVPMDPAHPESRRGEIVRDTAARIAVVSDTLQHLFSNLVLKTVVVTPKDLGSRAARNKSSSHLPRVQSDSPVFVLFTSGSTGKPKGIIHEHGGICSHAVAQIETMGYNNARVFQFSAFTFDVAMMDIFTTLIGSGCVCMPSEVERISDIAGAIRRMKAEHALITPSVANLINPKEVPTLKILALGGERLSQEVMDRWAAHVWLMNAYGPAEVGACTMATVRPGITRAETIGSPLPHCSSWVVDPVNLNQLMPAGSVGELLLTGSTLARGYLNNEVKTRASFVPAPLWAVEIGLGGSVFYRTGDLVRYNLDRFDGTLDIVGRIDAQIKVRGHRIELGEIEHHLATIPNVSKCMVAQPDQGHYAGQLVAVLQVQGVAMQDAKSPSDVQACEGPPFEDVKRHLARFVPSYMIPSDCIAVKFLPLNPSCKIDRRAVNGWLGHLSAPPVTNMSNDLLRSPLLSDHDLVAGTISTLLSKMVSRRNLATGQWLKGRDTPFVGLGLDSIQLMSFLIQLQRAYDCQIHISQLLNPEMTVARLASLISAPELPLEVAAVETFNPFSEADALVSELTGRLQSVDSLTSHPSPEILDHHVCVTGATGFLGGEVLRLLLEQNAHVYAVVRCATELEGLSRLRQMASAHGWWRDSLTQRLHVWPGDMSQPLLGLSSTALQQLSGTAGHGSTSIDTFIHCGAKVHYISDYKTLKAANVDSTVQIMEMAAQSSTLSRIVYVSGGEAPDFDADTAQLHQQSVAPMNGYSQTKLVSELIVGKCAQLPRFQGKDLQVVRPGYIIGSAARPRAVQTDFLWRLVAASLAIKACSQSSSGRWLYVSDVEHTAHVVTAGIWGKQTPGTAGVADPLCTPILDGILLDQFWDIFTTEFGYQLQPVSHDRWLHQLKAAALAQQDASPLFPFLSVLEHEIESFSSIPPSRSDKQPLTRERVRAAIIGNVQHLVETGFFPPARLSPSTSVSSLTHDGAPLEITTTAS